MANIETYINNIEPLCPEMDSYIQINDKIVIVYYFDKEQIEFYKRALKDNHSPLVFPSKEKSFLNRVAMCRKLNFPVPRQLSIF